MKQPIRTLLLALTFAAPLAAEEAVTYDRVDLTVSATAEVVNDRVTAVMYREAEGSDPVHLSGEVNRSISEAVAFAKRHEGIEVQTLDYRTSPIYRNKLVSGWRVRQSIALRSSNPGALSTLIGSLQSSLNLGSVSYGVSPEKRGEAEDALVDEAIARFGDRAERVTRSLGRADYRLVRMEIGTGLHPPRPRQVMMMAAEQAPPALEAGTQPLEVTVSGTIELAN